MHTQLLIQKEKSASALPKWLPSFIYLARSPHTRPGLTRSKPSGTISDHWLWGGWVLAV